MSEWNYSVVIIVPASNKAVSNYIAEKLGFGPNTFTVELSANGQSPATHYGCRSQARQSFIDIINQANEGIFPLVEGMTPEEVAATYSTWIVSTLVTDNGYEHFNNVVAGSDLQRIIPSITPI